MSTTVMDKPLHTLAENIRARNFTERFKYFSTSDLISPKIHSIISHFVNLHEFCLLALFSVFILFLFKSFMRNRKITDIKNDKCTPKSIPKLSHRFSIGITLLDEIYALHLLKTVGVRILDKWCAKFGPIFQMTIMSVKMYGIADASLAQKILSSCQPTHLNKAREIYNLMFAEFMQNGLIGADYDAWSPHRKMLSRCFTQKSLQHYIKIMNKHGKNLVNELSSVAMKTKAYENSGIPNSCVVQGEQIHEIIYCQVIKIIAQVVFGADDYFSDETLSEWTHCFRSLKYIAVKRFFNPILLFPPYWYFHPMKKEFERYQKYITDFFNKIIQVHRKEHKENMKTGEVLESNDIGEKPFRCLIQEMLFCNATDKEIYDEVGTTIGAGHETIIIAIQMLLVLLACNPDHQAKCRQEVDEFFRKKTGSDDKHDDELVLTVDDLTQLKYLERCILEGLRLLPSVVAFLRRLDAPLNIGDDIVELEKGSNVAIIPWLIHRNSEYYPNPEKFDPDRFLPENVKKRHPYSFIPFSAGSRNCIGYKMALMEMKVIMMWILRKFEVESKDKMEDVKLIFEITLSPERNYNLVLRKRSNI